MQCNWQLLPYVCHCPATVIIIISVLVALSITTALRRRRTMMQYDTPTT